MAEIIWTEPALADFQSITEYIALHDQLAAQNFVLRVDAGVTQLSRFPRSGSRIPEWIKSANRQLVVPPCRIFYRPLKTRVVVLSIIRHERLFRKSYLKTTHQT